MIQKTKEYKSTYRINGRPIISLLIGLGFFSVVLLAMMLSASKNVKYQSGPDLPADGRNSAAGSSDSQAALDGDKLLAVVTAIDPVNRQISLYDVESREALVLNYTGGTDITDKYGQALAMSQIDIGIMVDAAYRKDSDKLTGMNISTRAWKYDGVMNMSINRTDRVMKIASTKYKYNEDIIIIDGQEFIPVTDLAQQDELTVWGYEETIWSVTVTRGHGTVVLQNYAAFLGANITIGYESLQQIEEDMEITVREGSFSLTVENGKFSATKNIRVNRNKITYVTLSDLGPGALQQGRVTFEITPFGADLTIDGELISYANPIELLYGEHKLTVSLGGYTSYQGILNVDSAGKTIKIDLPEATGGGKAVVSETDTSNGNTAETGTQPGTRPDTQTGTQPDTQPDTGYTSPDNETPQDTGDTDTSSDTPDSTFDDEIIDTLHKIYVQRPLGASVYIDGEYMCTSPGSFEKIIGSHVITFIKEGYKTMSYTIEVSDDKLDTYFTFPELAEENGD